MVLGGTGSVEDNTGWYLEALGQYEAVLIGTWLFWVIIRQYWLTYSITGSVEGTCGTGLEQGGTGYQCDVLSEDIWFTLCKILY